MPGADYEIDDAVLDWLLEPCDPSVRAATLRQLLGRMPDDPDVVQAEAAINRSEPVKTILALQETGGGWGEPKNYYTGKYSSTVWTLLVLAELGATPGDERIAAACSFVLQNALHRESGGFSVRGGTHGGRGSGVIPCLTGNMLWALIRFGYLTDPGVQTAIGWFCHYQRFDDGDGSPTGWPYDNWDICWGRHTCHMGVVKMLKAFSHIPENMRSAQVSETIARGAEFMLLHHVFKRSHDLDRVSKPGWKRFGFPLMYQTDVLEIVNVLLDLGYRDPRMAEAVELVRSKRPQDGRWRLENSYNASLLVPVERKGEASKWITLNALRALMRYPLAKPPV